MIVGGVFDGGISGEEFSGEIGFGDGGVSAGKGVFGVTERARPDTRGVIDASIGV